MQETSTKISESTEWDKKHSAFNVNPVVYGDFYHFRTRPANQMFCDFTIHIGINFTNMDYLLQ